MSAAIATKRYTPEDLLRMPDGDRFELIDGNLVETDMSKESSYIAAEIRTLLRNYSKPLQSGYFFGADSTYQCFPHKPNMVRRPDASFITARRLSHDDYKEEGHTTIAPDLAVEVISPNDVVYELDEKVDDYLQAGVRLVWVVNPQNETVRIHRADGTVSQLKASDEITGEDVLSEFRCKVSEFFAPPLSP